jgi:hypothetical protein
MCPGSSGCTTTKQQGLQWQRWQQRQQQQTALVLCVNVHAAASSAAVLEGGSVSSLAVTAAFCGRRACYGFTSKAVSLQCGVKRCRTGLIQRITFFLLGYNPSSGSVSVTCSCIWAGRASHAVRIIILHVLLLCHAFIAEPIGL